MSNGRADEKTLAALHNAVAEDLLKKIASGEATAQELSAAIKFLKDNGIEHTRKPGDKLDRIAEVLPDFGDEDDASYPN